jgi:hypothetical protein
MAEREKTVFEVLTNWASELQEAKKKKTINKQEVIDKINSVFQDKQTVDVNILIDAPTKFEGLTKDQVSVFLKIFDGYKADLESRTMTGKATIIKTTPHPEGFEEIKSKPRITPTPPL